MHTLKIALIVAWVLFLIYWLTSAFSAEQGSASRRRIPLNSVAALSVILFLYVFSGVSLTVNSAILGAVGAVVFASGIALAVWARLHLGRNWGMPMTRKEEPELITSGPYRLIRHPIYSGFLVALLGTAIVINLVGLVLVVLLGAYFYYSAAVEEKDLAVAFPATYQAYRARTKMLIPLVL
jgi:protein-S-isoprenylcysteine O-methyltransferase Ste14